MIKDINRTDSWSETLWKQLELCFLSLECLPVQSRTDTTWSRMVRNEDPEVEMACFVWTLQEALRLVRRCFSGALKFSHEGIISNVCLDVDFPLG